MSNYKLIKENGHLFLVSKKDVIGTGEYYYTEDSIVSKSIYGMHNIQVEGVHWKALATTDDSLNLPSIPSYVVEEYYKNKNIVITSVKVDENLILVEIEQPKQCVFVVLQEKYRVNAGGNVVLHYTKLHGTFSSSDLAREYVTSQPISKFRGIGYEETENFIIKKAEIDGKVF